MCAAIFQWCQPSCYQVTDEIIANINMFGLAEINTGAKISGTNISKLEVTLQKPGDEIQYLINYNMR